MVTLHARPPGRDGPDRAAAFLARATELGLEPYPTRRMIEAGAMLEGRQAQLWLLAVLTFSALTHLFVAAAFGLAEAGLGTASTPARRTIVTFHEGLAWVAQLGLFLTLG